VGSWDEVAAAISHEAVDHEEIRIPHQSKHGFDAMIVRGAGDGLVYVILGVHIKTLVPWVRVPVVEQGSQYLCSMT
jgi:hypothetical protein